MTDPLISAITALVTAAALTALLLTAALARGVPGWLDLPNERSLHARPVPRIGGLAMLIGCVLTQWFGFQTQALDAPRLTSYALWLAALALALVSAIDDRRGLAVLPRLLTHAGAAIALVASLTLTGAGGSGMPLTTVAAGLGMVLMLVWTTNLYNFMDGADGLAGSIAAIGFAGYAWMTPPGDPLGWFCWTLRGAAVGFLACNWHPARVFLGDAGSIPLGFLAAGVGLVGSAHGFWPWWTPVGLFLPFFLDATTTLIIRLLKGRKVWQAHREHAYQRLILAGWRTPWVVAAYAIASLLATIMTISLAT